MKHALESSENPILDDNGLSPIVFPVYVKKMLPESVLENILLLAEELAPFEYLVTEEGLTRAEVIELLEDGGVFNGMVDFLAEFLNPFVEKIFDDIRESIKKNPHANVRTIIDDHTRSLQRAIQRAMTDERPTLSAFLCELTDITACTVMLHDFMRDELKKNPDTLKFLGVQEDGPHWYEEFVNEYSKLAYNGDPAMRKRAGITQSGQYEYKRLQCLYRWMLFASILRQGNPASLDPDFVKQCKEEADKMCGVVKEMDFDLPDEVIGISASEYARGSFPATYAIGSTIAADLNLFSMFQGEAQMRIPDGERNSLVRLEFGFSRVLNDLTLPFIDMIPARRVLELYGVDQGYCDLIRFNFLKALLETHDRGNIKEKDPDTKKKDLLEEKMAEIFSNPAITGIFKSLENTPSSDSIEIDDEEKESTGQNNGSIRLHNLSRKRFIRALVRCGALLARSSGHLVFKRETAKGTRTSIVSHGADGKGHKGRLFGKTLKELGIPVQEFAVAAGLGK